LEKGVDEISTDEIREFIRNQMEDFGKSRE